MKRNILLTLLIVLCAVGDAIAQTSLYACGGFNGWNPKSPSQFVYKDGLYTLEIDFSGSEHLKISTVKGVNDNGWAEFDTGTIAVDGTPAMNTWMPIFFVNNAPNITAPARKKMTVVVDLDRMLINFGGEGEPQAEWSGTLPVMFINTENSQPIVEKETYLNATYYIDPMGLPDVKGLGSAAEPLTTQIKGRGNYTWVGFDKKPYRLKFTEKQSPLGMPKSKHFVLLAHADDRDGFLRNETGFALSRLLGMPWTPESQPIELVINGNYRGLYFLTQNIRVDKDRVNIVEQDDLATTDVDGGWLVEIDNYDTDPHVTVLENGNANHPIWFTYKSPEELSTEQDTYLQSQMQAIDNAIYSSPRDGDDTALSRLVDFDILARYYITQEIVDDGESFHGSCYLNRNRGEQCKWMFGPVWDFGNAFMRRSTNQFIWQNPPFHQVWIGAIYKFPAFQAKVKEIWGWYLGFGPDALEKTLTDYIDKIAVAAQYDAARWPQYGNPDVKARYAEIWSLIQGKTDWLKTQWGSQAGIETIQPDTPTPDAPTDVYTLQGIKILTKATPSQIANLPPGLYLTPTAKLLIK